MTGIMIGALVGAGVLAAVPAIAIAGNVLVDHGRGPTVVHDAAYAGVKTQVHSWAARRRHRRAPHGARPARQPHLRRPRPRDTLRRRPAGVRRPLPARHRPRSPLAEREVWLDFTTDERATASGTTHIPWLIAAGTAGSVVIHANPTNTTTGAAGARLVCTDVPFGE